MCGICGIFRPDGRVIDPDRVVRMRDVMTFRGPDGAGLSHGPGFALGHRRLSIIDLSDAGAQPMANEDGSIQITFNGEIYNFAELRSQLEAADHNFASRTDTEVLLHGYETWGLEGLLRRIRGMYALALLDRRQNQIHLARDPLGKKPLFLHWSRGELVFSSSARSLVRGMESTPPIDPAAIENLLWNLYIPGPGSIFQGVEKLLPGHAATFSSDGTRSDLVHWQPDFLHPDERLDEEECLERVEAALTTAVQRRLVADVPLGVMLSGGVDSGLVTAVAARVRGQIETFSVAADDPAIDESSFALAVAKRYGTAHRQLRVRSDVRQTLPELVATMGEPLADASAANLFAISGLARQSVTVVLTGDGGDEGFGGYSYMRSYYYAGRLRRLLPPPLRRPVAAMGEALRRAPGSARRAGTLLRLAGLPPRESFSHQAGWLDRSLRSALFTPAFLARLNGHGPSTHYERAFDACNGANPVDQVTQAHARTILPDDYLAKVDLATMGASLEARCPFLDLDLLELAMRIPASLRFRRGEPKGLLRELARRLLPREVVDRRKQGFLAPVGQWLRRPDWSDLVDDMVLGGHVERRGWFQRDTLKQMVDEHRRGVNRAYLLWSLIILELWLRQTTDGAGAA
jgi:asparagine synthase (glutamine-hydrolysing)